MDSILCLITYALHLVWKGGSFAIPPRKVMELSFMLKATTFIIFSFKSCLVDEMILQQREGGRQM